MKFSGKVVLAEGQGRRGRWGIKAGDIFVSKQGYAFLELYANVWIKLKCRLVYLHFLKLYMSKLNGTLEEKVHLVWVLRVGNTYIF